MKQFVKESLSRSRWSLLFFLAYNYKIRLSPRKFYGQLSEDAILQTLLPERNGSYLDIGCGNPIKTSNTFVFYRRGWSGTVVDPILLNKKLFKLMRPKDRFILAVVGGTTASTKFWEMRPYEYSTANQSIAEELVSRKIAHLVAVSHIPSLAMADLDISMKPRDPTLLCIDAESFDYHVLVSNDWKKILPRVICVEEVADPNVPRKIENFLEEFGYTKYAWVGLSSVYIHNSYQSH
jgi:hypothetical protein